MPLVTVTVRKPKTPAFTSAVLAAVHQGLIGAGVPEADRFQRVLALGEDEFRYDPRYPDRRRPDMERAEPRHVQRCRELLQRQGMDRSRGKRQGRCDVDSVQPGSA